MRVLVAEDERRVADAVARGLRREGMAVDVAYDGSSALDKARLYPYDVVVLDRDLPRLHGDEVCRILRREEPDRRVLMLTAAAGVDDLVDGLSLGADDYLGKPFAFEELLMRVKALLRRGGNGTHASELRFAGLRMDRSTREARRGDRAIALTTTEYELLRLFLLHPRQVLTRDRIYERVWGYDFGGESKVIEVYVRYLREKLEAGGEPRLIQTVRGAGYVLKETA